MTTLPTREQIERAQPLAFDQAKAEKQANIQIQVSPVVVEYTGGVSSIAAALERLRAVGVVELVDRSRPVPAPLSISTPNRKPKAERVDQAYLADGTPICPAHRKLLLESQYGGWYESTAKQTCCPFEKIAGIAQVGAR